MKKFNVALAMFALVLGVALSSFTTKVASTQTDYVWFDVRVAGYDFLGITDPSTMATQESLSITGSVVGAIGYLEDKLGEAYTVEGEADPVIILDAFEQPLASDEDLFQP